MNPVCTELKASRILHQLNIWLTKRLPSTEYEHPTQKPPTVYEKALRRCTKPGDMYLTYSVAQERH